MPQNKKLSLFRFMANKTKNLIKTRKRVVTEIGRSNSIIKNRDALEVAIPCKGFTKKEKAQN